MLTFFISFSTIFDLMKRFKVPLEISEFRQVTNAETHKQYNGSPRVKQPVCHILIVYFTIEIMKLVIHK